MVLVIRRQFYRFENVFIWIFIEYHIYGKLQLSINIIHIKWVSVLKLFLFNDIEEYDWM